MDPALVVRDKEGKPYSVRYDQVNAMLLNEFLKEHRKVEKQQAIIAELQSTLASQRKKFEVTTAKQQKEIQALTVGLQKVSAQVGASALGAKVIAPDNQRGKRKMKSMNQPIEFNAQIPLPDQRVTLMSFRLAGSARFCLAALGFTRIDAFGIAPPPGWRLSKLKKAAWPFCYMAACMQAHSTQQLACYSFKRRSPTGKSNTDRGIFTSAATRRARQKKSCEAVAGLRRAHRFRT